MSDENKPALPAIKGRTTLPILPLRDMVVFPHMIAPLFVGRPKSVSALEQVASEKGRIMLVTQKTRSKTTPAKTMSIKPAPSLPSCKSSNSPTEL